MIQATLNFSSESRRLSRQCGAILDLLRDGPQTNLALNQVCFRYGARIHELRKAGYEIKSTRVGDGVWRFELTGETQGWRDV